jgi:enoyl-CoA hydratase
VSDELVLLKKDGVITWVTINRPKALNAFNTEVLRSLRAAVEQIRNDAGTKVVIVTGAGEKAFVAGADITEVQKMSPLEAKDFSDLIHATLDEIAALPQPVIAAINGFALGGGCELALACDLRIAADTAKLGLPEVAIGVFPGGGGTQRLPRLVGSARAKYLIFTGEAITAAESERIGLVNKVVPRENLVDEVMALAIKISAQGPLAVRLAKEAVNKGAGMELGEAQALEAGLFALVFSSPEQKEGMTAFIEKRKPNF